MTPDQLHVGMSSETVVEVVKAHLKAMEKSIDEVKSQIATLDLKIDHRDVELSKALDDQRKSLYDQNAWKSEVRGSVNMVKWVLGILAGVFAVIGGVVYSQITDAQKELTRMVDDHATIQTLKSRLDADDIELGIIKQQQLQESNGRKH